MTLELFQALHMSVLLLRTCNTEVRHSDEPEHGAICWRPATWRRPTDDGESQYSCDVCHVLFTESGPEWVEAPHAKAIRAFDRLAGTVMDEWSPVCVANITRRLLAALPPCPIPLSSTNACDRCIWADGLKFPDQDLRARKQLDRLWQLVSCRGDA